MKNSIKMALCLIGISLILFLVCVNVAQSEEKVVIKEEDIIIRPTLVKDIIEEVAIKFDQDPILINKISFCESRHKVASHDGGRGINVTGIHDKTFKGWLSLYEKETEETLDINSTYDQLKMMSWAFSKGEKYRRQWTTYVAYKNGGTYTFYSKLLKGTYTAKCK